MSEKKKKASLPSLALCFQPRPDLLFDCSRVLEYAKIWTVLPSKAKAENDPFVIAIEDIDNKLG